MKQDVVPREGFNWFKLGRQLKDHNRQVVWLVKILKALVGAFSGHCETSRMFIDSSGVQCPGVEQQQHRPVSDVSHCHKLFSSPSIYSRVRSP